MISYGSVRFGAVVSGDSACTSISQSYISQSQANFIDDLSREGIFVSPDPHEWLLESVSKYLSLSASIAQSNASADTSESYHNRKKNSVLERAPDWDSLARSGAISDAHARALAMMSSLSHTSSLKDLVNANPEILQAFSTCLRAATGDERPTIYLTTFFLDGCRRDASSWGLLLTPDFQEFSSSLSLAMTRSASNSALQVKIAVLYSGLVAHAGPTFFATDNLRVFIKQLPENLPSAVVLDIACSLLKQPAYRAIIWEALSFSDAILCGAKTTNNEAVIYKSMFALWVTSFDIPLFESIAKKCDTIKIVENVLLTLRTEKVIRVSILLLRNLLDSHGYSVEIVESNILNSLNSLEYEKWKEQDVANDIKDLQNRITHATASHSNISRYERELLSGTLSWSYVHSDKFWNENWKLFEMKDFFLIKQLVDIALTSTDQTTLAVACYDIGEFARVHPMGKRVLSKIDAKSRVMALMTHPGRDVAREALLCTQKLMLNNWQNLA